MFIVLLHYNSFPKLLKLTPIALNSHFSCILGANVSDNRDGTYQSDTMSLIYIL